MYQFVSRESSYFKSLHITRESSYKTACLFRYQTRKKNSKKKHCILFQKPFKLIRTFNDYLNLNVVRDLNITSISIEVTSAVKYKLTRIETSIHFLVYLFQVKLLHTHYLCCFAVYSSLKSENCFWYDFKSVINFVIYVFTHFFF